MGVGGKLMEYGYWGHTHTYTPIVSRNYYFLEKILKDLEYTSKALRELDTCIKRANALNAYLREKWGLEFDPMYEYKVTEDWEKHVYKVTWRVI